MDSSLLTTQELEILIALLGQATATGTEAMRLVVALEEKLQEAMENAEGKDEIGESDPPALHSEGEGEGGDNEEGRQEEGRGR